MLKCFLSLSLLLFLTACSDTKESTKGSASSGMKCGAGKCGANMFDGKGALAKKKKNILSQMRDSDPRKTCVIEAKNTKEVYNCVRSSETKKMRLKCGEGKCGNDKQRQSMPSMKCGAGKCGSTMSEKEPKKATSMKCGEGKCGAM